jgi:hypothetical protein
MSVFTLFINSSHSEGSFQPINRIRYKEGEEYAKLPFLGHWAGAALGGARFASPSARARGCLRQGRVRGRLGQGRGAAGESDDAKAKDPVARLLMGHASLALNRGNDATVLFRSVTEGKDLADWKAWADKLVQAKPGSPVALYLAADAAARSGDLKTAIAGFRSGH